MAKRRKTHLKRSSRQQSHSHLKSVPSSPNSKFSVGSVPNVMWILSLLFVIAGFMILKLFAVNAYAGDEFIYVYQGNLIANGDVPYRDFSMAHPPMQSLFTALLFKICGYNFTLARLLPFLWATAAAVVLALLVRREYGNLTSIFAAAIALFAYEVLRGSSHYTGVNMTMAFLLGAFLTFRSNHLKICALLCVLAVFTRLYAIPGVIGMVIWAWLGNKKRGRTLTIWGAGFAIVAFVAIGLWSGFEAVIDNLVAYHAQKTPMKQEKLSNIKHTILFHNAIPIFLFALSIPTVLIKLTAAYDREKSTGSIWSRIKTAVVVSNTGLALLSAFIVFLFAIILLNMNRVWMYYFVPMLFFSAIGGAFLIRSWIDGAISLARHRGFPKQNGPNRYHWIWLFASVLLFVVAYYTSPKLETRLSYYKRAMEKTPLARVKSYSWQDGMIPEVVNQLVKSLFWHDTRTIGEPYNSITYLLWHESRHFHILDEMVTHIREETQPTDTIFGDSGTVPLLALESQRRISDNQVDTNLQQYRSNSVDPNQVVQSLNRLNTKLIILRLNGNRPFGVAAVKQIQALVKSKYSLIHRYRTIQGWNFLMFKRKS